MMKQFLRVKQIADQKFQRNEKSSVLSHELNAAEKRVDLIKESCYATGKKLAACMQRILPDVGDRKNAKKTPEAALAQCMEEWGLSLGESSILGLTLVDYARIQETLANDLLSYKLQVEENVVEPLQNILNVDISNIMKYRKQLSKLTSEMESAKTRYQNAQRNSVGSHNGAAAKAQLLKEETEDVLSRLEQCRDSLSSEMFHLISREPEMSGLMVRFCQLQLEYHRKAYFMLEAALPEIESQINECPYQPVFGVPLESHLKTSKREIATVLEMCVCWLLESAMEEEGLFRIGGSMIKIKKLKSAFDAGFHHLIEEEKDPHNVAGVLKLYLRSLPEPLLTFDLYDHWIEAAMDPDHDSRLRSLWSVVNFLPEAHLRNLKYLIKFLSKLCQNSDTNKMSIQNVAIVIGPNLLWPPVEDSALGLNMTSTNLHSSIVDTLITYADWFFPGDCEFYVSTPTTPRHLNGQLIYGSELSLTTTKLSNGDSAVDSMSSSPTNSSPKSPSPRIPIRPRKKAAPKAPAGQPITRSVSCSVFQATALAKAANQARMTGGLSISHENLINAGYGQMDNKVHNLNSSAVPRSQPLDCRPARSKPPRPNLNNNKNGLPPLAERSRRSVVERPSVPPPERPDSFTRSETVDSNSYFERSLESDRAELFSRTDTTTSNRSQPFSRTETVSSNKSEPFSRTATVKSNKSVAETMNSSRSELFCRGETMTSNQSMAETMNSNRSGQFSRTEAISSNQPMTETMNCNRSEQYYRAESLSSNRTELFSGSETIRHGLFSRPETMGSNISGLVSETNTPKSHFRSETVDSDTSSRRDTMESMATSDLASSVQSESISFSLSSEDKSKAVDLEDISISFDSSSSDSYNECQMSFADDSDNDLARCDSLGSDSGRKDSSHLMAERKDSSHLMAERKDSSHLMAERKDSSHLIPERKDSSHLIAERNDSSHLIAERKDSSHSMAARKDSSDLMAEDFKNKKKSVESLIESGGSIKVKSDVSIEKEGFLDSLTPEVNRFTEDTYSFEKFTFAQPAAKVQNGNHEDPWLPIHSRRPSSKDDVFKNGHDEITKGKSQDSNEENHFEDSNLVWEGHVSASSPAENSADDGCHFVGGTPTWFDHYGEDKSYSNTVWFSEKNQNGEDKRSTNTVWFSEKNHQSGHQMDPPKLSCIQEDVPCDDNFRTVIQVDNTSSKQSDVLKSYAVKLRVNSETHDTRL